MASSDQPIKQIRPSESDWRQRRYLPTKLEADLGTMTLCGKIESWSERDEAERAAWSSPGVGNVLDLLTIN